MWDVGRRTPRGSFTKEYWILCSSVDCFSNRQDESQWFDNNENIGTTFGAAYAHFWTFGKRYTGQRFVVDPRRS